jgi:ribosomal protein S21
MKIMVKDLDRAMKKFKRVSSEKLLDLRKYEYAEKSSVEKRRRKSAAKRREYLRQQNGNTVY